MKVKTLTMYILLIVVVILIAYDFYAISSGGTSASISHLIKVWGHKYPIIPFSFGVLCGHFFWGVKTTKELKKIDETIKDLDNM